MKYLLIPLVILFFLAVSSCEKGAISVNSGPEKEIVTVEEGDSIEIPDPQIVNKQNLPSTTIYKYYLIRTHGNDDIFENGPEELLRQLLSQHIQLRYAWYPTYPTPCMAPTAVDALVVDLQKRDRRMKEFGFISSPGSWYINCGIKQFYLYRFEHVQGRP